MSEKDTEGDSVKADVTIRLERQLDAAQQITHIGSWEWDLATGASPGLTSCTGSTGWRRGRARSPWRGSSRACILTIASACSAR